MNYIIQRQNRFYVIAYDGLDPLTGKERRRWHPAGNAPTPSPSPDNSTATSHQLPLPADRSRWAHSFGRRGNTMRVLTLLYDAHGALLNLGNPWRFDTSPWAARVLAIDAKYAGTRELPVLGQVAVPAAVLNKPDGYAA